MADKQTNSAEPSKLEPLSLRAFADLCVSSLRIHQKGACVGHIGYDIRAAQKDINVIFPLTRFRELVEEGSIGALAERNYSYHGLTNIPRLMQESAPSGRRCSRTMGWMPSF